MSNTDFSGLTDFRDKIAALGDGRCEKFCDDCNKELAAMLLAKAVKKTPVGVKPEITSDTQNEIWEGYTGGTLRRGWTTGEISRMGNKHTIDVINQVPYASYVEYGHTQQPGRYVPALNKKLKKGWVKGQFMMTNSVKELQPKAQGIVDRKLNEFLQEELK
jgi:hypothetical protein